MIGVGAAKYAIRGSDCVGAFASATERCVFIGSSLPENCGKVISEALKTDCISISVANSEIIGIFMRANSRGVLLSNLATDYEVECIRKLGMGLEVRVLDSPFNAIGNNIIANDKVAIVNPQYDSAAIAAIADTLDVEVVRMSIGSFKTVGANDILTNRGLVVNNRCSDEEKMRIDEVTGFDSVRTTANTGSFGVGIGAVANSKGIVAGDDTTGFELARMIEGLNIED